MPVVVKKEEARKLAVIGNLRSQDGERLYRPPKPEPAQELPEKSDTAKALEMVAESIRDNRQSAEAIAQAHLNAIGQLVVASKEIPTTKERQSNEEWEFEVIRDQAGKISRVKAIKGC